MRNHNLRNILLPCFAGFLGICLAATGTATPVYGQEPPKPKDVPKSPNAVRITVTPAQNSALDAITAESARGHVAFLASDLLEGRDTPSRGLEVAAEYIAAAFRRAGLSPIVAEDPASGRQESYFQTVNLSLQARNPDAFRLTAVIRTAENTATPLSLTPNNITLIPGSAGNEAVKLDNLPIVIIADPSAAADKLPNVNGKAVIVTKAISEPSENPRRIVNNIRTRFQTGGAKVVLILDPGQSPGQGAGMEPARLTDPNSNSSRSGFRLNLPARNGENVAPILIRVHDPLWQKTFADLPNGQVSNGVLNLSVPALETKPSRQHNVVGLLPGSDPQLANTYVLLTAHYDHLGIGDSPTSDKIFNGANDNASGTAGLLEIAQALGKLKPEDRPKRGIVFIAFCAEEKGLIGSKFYAKNPVFPLQNTVACLNLEQIGRTDDNEGPRIAAANLTGMDYSDVGDIVRTAAATPVAIIQHPRFSDPFFAASDNKSLADIGIPAHTLSVAYMFPDYHQVGDHWQKLDYPNMALIIRAIGRSIVALANTDAQSAPRWSETNRRAARYLEAAKTLYSKQTDAQPKP